MSKLVKHTQLKEIFTDLWNKVKLRDITGGTFTRDTKTLSLTRQVGNVDVNLSGVVTRWKDLEHTKEYEVGNILNYEKREARKALDDTGKIVSTNEHWGIVEFYPISNEEYTILRQRNGNVKIRFELSNGNMSFTSGNTTNTNGYNRFKFQTPADTVRAFFEIQLSHAQASKEMIVHGDHMQTTIIEDVPYTDGYKIQTSNTSLKFDNTGTNIKETTVESAIKELEKKNEETVNSLGNYVHKNKDTTISGKISLVDPYLTGHPFATLNNINATHAMGSDDCYSATSTLKVDSGVLLGHIIIGMDDSVNVGDVVTGINVGIVNFNTNVLEEYIYIGESAICKENSYTEISANKVIAISIDRKFDHDVYLLVGAKGMKWGQREYGTSHVSSGGNALPDVGTTFSLTTGNYIGQVMLVGDGVSLIEELRGMVHNSKPNTFTEMNTFTNFSPIISREFIVSAHGANFLNLMEYNEDKYVYTIEFKSISTNGYTDLFIPIANAEPRDTVEISYFVVNGDTNRVIEEEVTQECEIVDRQFLGYYCAKVPLQNNNAYAHSVGFGLKITPKTIGNRNLRLVYSNGVSGTSWTGVDAPNNGAYLTSVIPFAFPYLTSVYATSPIVTRFEIENNLPNIIF